MPDNVVPGDWLYFEINAFMESKDKPQFQDHCEVLVLEMIDEKNKTQVYKASRISPFIGNHNYSIWSLGEPGQWGKASFYYKIPKAFKPDWKLKVRLYNHHGQKLYLDDFYVKHYRRE